MGISLFINFNVTMSAEYKTKCPRVRVKSWD